VRVRRTLSSCGRLPQSALAGLLALLLLAAASCSASHALHQSLHSDGATGGHFCLLCSFAKGQVSVAAVAVMAGAIVFCCLSGLCLLATSPYLGFDYRTSPSRAPPLH
jgi:hypothetical protein